MKSQEVCYGSLTHEINFINKVIDNIFRLWYSSCMETNVQHTCYLHLTYLQQMVDKCMLILCLKAEQLLSFVLLYIYYKYIVMTATGITGGYDRYWSH